MMTIKKMRIELREKIKTTDKEFESVKENDRLTLSEELHGRGKRSSKYRARYDPGVDEFAIFGEEY